MVLMHNDYVLILIMCTYITITNNNYIHLYHMYNYVILKRTLGCWEKKAAFDRIPMIAESDTLPYGTSHF